MASIELRNVVKRYGDGPPAVDDVSLHIPDGELTVLAGPPGCGKSTLLRMIVGLEDVTAGDVLIDGRRVNDLPPRERHVSLVFQNYALYPHLTVFDNMAFPLLLQRLDDAEVRRRVTAAADVLELGEQLDLRPGDLSGGQRQRVAMGRAIVREAGAFLFDEPLSSLDLRLRAQMRAEIGELQRRIGITTVYVTRDQGEAMALGDRVAVLRGGHLQQVGAPGEVYERPVNLFVAAFVGTPPMGFLPATVRGDRLQTPLGTLRLHDPLAGAVAGRDLVVVGVRPEVVEDAARTEPAATEPGSVLRGRVEGTDRVAGARYAYVPVEAPGTVAALLREVARDLGRDLGSQLAVPLDAVGGVVGEGQEVELAVDPRAVHLFDPDSGEALARDAAGRPTGRPEGPEPGGEAW